LFGQVQKLFSGIPCRLMLSFDAMRDPLPLK